MEPHNKHRIHEEGHIHRRLMIRGKLGTLGRTPTARQAMYRQSAPQPILHHFSTIAMSLKHQARKITGDNRQGKNTDRLGC